MSWRSLVSALGAACGRRRQAPGAAAEPGFWEAAPALGAGPGLGEEAPEPPGYEQAAHLKDEGNERFARGGDVADAMDCWLHALDALCAPPEQPTEQQGPPCTADDTKVLELRATLLLNLALGHKRLKQWRQVVSCCEEALLERPGSIKALYRKADALGELCAWREAEEAAARLEEAGEEGRRLAAQKREEWRRRRRAADGRQRKMWSAALSESLPGSEMLDEGPLETECSCEEGAWAMSKVAQMSVFDLRREGIEWAEEEDFDDAVWRDGLGHRDASFYQRRALPLTLLAAAALAKLSLPEELVLHCLLDGNAAAFAEAHDWGEVLRRCPALRRLTVVYVDIGAVAAVPGAPPPVPYGALLRPTEEGRVGERVALAARFLGTYREFREHCRELPGLVLPHLALWADVPLYGFGEEDLKVRLEAFGLLSAAGVPSIVTQGGEVPQRGGPPMAPRADDHASLSAAILDVGLGARALAPWSWNRFVVPLERGTHGILAAHALLAVLGPEEGMAPPQAAGVKAALSARGVELVPFVLPQPQLSREEEFRRLRKQQWEAFCEKMREAGRPVGAAADEQERNRQSMEFCQFCGVSTPGAP